MGFGGKLRDGFAADPSKLALAAKPSLRPISVGFSETPNPFVTRSTIWPGSRAVPRNSKSLRAWASHLRKLLSNSRWTFLGSYHLSAKSSAGLTGFGILGLVVPM